jgi:hypothetical protein
MQVLETDMAVASSKSSKAEIIPIVDKKKYVKMRRPWFFLWDDRPFVVVCGDHDDVRFLDEKYENAEWWSYEDDQLEIYVIERLGKRSPAASRGMYNWQGTFRQR